MRYIIGAVIVIAIVIGVIAAAFIARRASKEESALTMHPDNFKKPGIEQVEKITAKSAEENTTGFQQPGGK